MNNVATLLTSGGDKRILCDPVTGHNQYGCAPVPGTSIIAYGSSTASTISATSYAAITQLYERLGPDINASIYAQEMERIRQELWHLMKLEKDAADIIFAASGTDVHLLIAQLIRHSKPLMVIIADSCETGSGVHAALRGEHFSDCSAFASVLAKDAAIEGGEIIEVATVASRNAHSSPRIAARIDAECEARTEEAIKAGKHVLLTLIDVSKTGLIIPSLACVARLQERFGAQIDVLVDACQWRISPSTLRSYVAHNCMVASTGSKFVTGPAFSGAVFVPHAIAERLRTHALPPALTAYSARADWPQGWAAHDALEDKSNYGLLLRWHAALVHMQDFYAQDEKAVAEFLHAFATSVCDRISADPAFELLPGPALDRSAMVTSQHWDTIPTLFPFLLRHTQSHYFSRAETRTIYQDLQNQHYFLGQPVDCGDHSALRVCMDMRLVVDALQGRGSAAVIAEALALLDAVAARAILTPITGLLF